MTLFDVVSQDVSLTVRGVEAWGLCPFHVEKTPSFSVNVGKEVFHCFGCGAKGDAITYLRQKRGLSFHDAKRALGLDVLPYPVRKSPQQRALEQTRAAYLRWERETSEQITRDYWRTWEAKEATVLHMALLMMQREEAPADEWEHRQRTLDALQLQEHFLLVEISAFHDPGRLAERVQRWEREGRAA